MGTSSSKWRELYESRIGLIDQIVGFVCRRNGLRGEDGEDFRSEVHLKLIDGNFSILRQFDGRSSIRTYLTVVITRLLLDFRTERWGKWRPSEAARRMGDDAVLLETLMVREGHDFGEAVSIMQTSHGTGRDRDELYEMTLRFPARWGRSSTREISIDETMRAVERNPEQMAMDEEILECERLLSEVLQKEVDAADPEDRALLRLVHLEGRKISTISRTLQIDQQQLYRRMQRLQKRLRDALERSGLGWERTVRLLEEGSFRRRLDLDEIFGRSPSNKDVAFQQVREGEASG